ncbi:hypothetical protein LINPERHAP1_LOCUS21727 [Linum perenne]
MSSQARSKGATRILENHARSSPGNSVRPYDGCEVCDT